MFNDSNNIRIMSYSKYSAKVMRSFHNRVKGSLIQRAVYESSNCVLGSVKLFDVGVGRGGDMFKWDKCNITHVIGYDPDPSSIEEAQRRYVQSNLPSKREYVFQCCNEIDDIEIPENTMDIVSCQFAIHYFFESQATLSRFLASVSRMLKPGGIFVGTFMDRYKVREYTFDGTAEFMNSAMLLHAPNHSVDAFSPLKVHLTGTLYFGENTVSNEYVVCRDVLESECEKHGLTLVEYKTFQQYHDDYASDFKMNGDCTTCSYAYSSFMFRKN